MALRNSDRAYVLEAGQIVMADTSRELMVNPAVAAAYLGKQVADR